MLVCEIAIMHNQPTIVMVVLSLTRCQIELLSRIDKIEKFYDFSSNNANILNNSIFYEKLLQNLTTNDHRWYVHMYMTSIVLPAYTSTRFPARQPFRLSICLYVRLTVCLSARIYFFGIKRQILQNKSPELAFQLHSANGVHVCMQYKAEEWSVLWKLIYNAVMFLWRHTNFFENYVL